jgi:hypothetical protein
MTLLHASAERTVSAPAAAVYDRLADYRVGHPSILPPSFSDLKVLQGGTGAGTEIRFAMTLGGRKQLVEASVDEPEPGRVLTETYPDRGAVTSFTSTRWGLKVASGSKLREKHPEVSPD